MDVLKSFETERNNKMRNYLSLILFTKMKKMKEKKRIKMPFICWVFSFEFKLKDELLYKIQIDYTNIIQVI